MLKRYIGFLLWLSPLLAIHGICAGTLSQEQPLPPAFREPFTVKFKFDKKTVEQKVERTPYVLDSTVYLYPGEDFGINIKREGNEIVEVRYQPDAKKADVGFAFSVRKIGSHTMMTLATVNNLDKSLEMEGWMLLPGYDHTVKTSIMPVLPHVLGLETWPQPLVMLQLQNLRLTKPPEGLSGPHP